MTGFYPTGAEATGGTTPTITGTQPATPTVSGVTVSPASASLAGGAQQQFTATVSGTNSPSQGVMWSASAGTINSAGLFTAPSATSSQQSVTITATSTADGTKSGTATVTVAASAPAQPTVSSVTVSPSTKTMQPGQQQQFGAVVNGTNNPSQAVTWSKTGGGTLTPGGLFTAPAATDADQSIFIVAISVQDDNRSGMAVVTVPAQVVIDPGAQAATVAVTIKASDQQGNPMAGADISAILDRVDIDDASGYIAPEEITALADGTGTAILHLWPNVRGTQGSKYDFKITNPDTGKILRVTASIPEADCYLHRVALPPEP